MRFPLFLFEGAADFVVAVFVFLEGGEVMFFPFLMLFCT